MLMLWWFDDDRKKTVTEKIAEALAAYERKFSQSATVVLLNAEESIGAQSPVPLRVESYIQRSHFYIGVEEQPTERGRLTAR